MNPAAVWQHLWQSTLFLVAAAAALRFSKHGSARMRHAAWLVVSAKFAIPAALLAWFGGRASLLFHVPAPAPETVAAIGRWIGPLRAAPDLPPSPDGLSPFWLAMAGLWLCGAVGVLIRWRLQAISGPVPVRAPSSAELASAERARLLMNVSRQVPLLIAHPHQEPGVWGIWRPVLVLPDRIAGRLTQQQFESVLLHEMAHIRAWDNLAGAWQRLVSAAFWFHPPLWWMERKMAAERELACDEAVAESGIDARDYATAILETCRFCLAGASPAVSGAASPDLKSRLERIMSKQAVQKSRWHAAAVGLLAASMLLFPLLTAWTCQVRAQGPNRELREMKIVPHGAPAGNHDALLEHVRLALRGPGRVNPDDVAKLGAYGRWLVEDVAGLITDSERSSFLALETDAQRNEFIEKFWKVRNPDPSSERNQFREEYYRRIAYANNRFASAGVPGAATDRGLVYRALGPPDEIESHPKEGRESWLYHHVDGTGDDLLLTFAIPPKE